ncbi:MAG: ATP synthase F0 subunit B [Bdellovibrionaceae bacterium]|nr:ATP synthase F0 subunit B [Pseudobdellovibrionaceae bacterium]
MSAIINILVSLGVNKTVFYQLAIFLVAFLYLKHFVFGPYLAAYIERRKKTVGHNEVAKEMSAELEKLEADYSAEAKALNDKMRVVFAEKRAEGAKEATRIIESGFVEAQKALVEGKKEIDAEYGKAREEMKSYVPSLGDAMVERLVQQ